MNAKLLKKVRGRYSYFYNQNKLYVLDRRNGDHAIYKSNDPTAVSRMVGGISKKHAKLFFSRWVKRRSTW